jgi:hypothetical protein
VLTTTLVPDLSSPVVMVCIQPSCVHCTARVVPADCPFTVTSAVAGGSEPGGCGEVVGADEQPAMPPTAHNAATVTTTNRFCTAQI